MNTNKKINKYPKQTEVKAERFINFAVNWTGNRTPDFVIFPSGRKTKINYMRDGIILFESGESGTYVRTYDNNETKERTVIINYELGE